VGHATLNPVAAEVDAQVSGGEHADAPVDIEIALADGALTEAQAIVLMQKQLEERMEARMAEMIAAAQLDEAALGGEASHGR
jgi:hypothetical protein